jgi:dTDP-4-amino-4,6-dideoxygalactose transaminase
MIPRHRPPFSTRQLMKWLLCFSEPSTVQEVEEGYAKSCELCSGILLPSARVGILWALKVAGSENLTVLAPAYTCQVVHEASVRALGPYEFIDADTSTFLMDGKAVRLASRKRNALILSEIYGYKYDISQIRTVDSLSDICIHDAAMSIPMPKAFKSFQEKDFVVISFGIGKSMYSGWGAIGLTNNEGLAGNIRDMRDRFVSGEKMSLTYRRGIEILLRTAANESLFYGLSRNVSEHVFGRAREKKLCECKPLGVDSIMLSECGREWYLPSTSLDRFLCMINLRYREHYARRKLRIAERYEENLRGIAEIRLPHRTDSPMSHYTIRVDAPKRESIRKCMYKSGVDTGVLFPFSLYLPERGFPKTRAISAQIINLPMNINLSVCEVDQICEKLIACIRTLDR